MWAVIAILCVVVATWAAGVSRFAFLAMVHDSLPVVLVGAWVATGYGVATERWVLTASAGVLLGVHGMVVAPRVSARRSPEWVDTAPRVRVAMANVFVGNRTPARAATMLVGTGAEVLVVAERNDGFMRGFAAIGGRTAYPFVIDEDYGRPEYLIAALARVPFEPGARVVHAGSIPIVQGAVRCGDAALTVLAVHLAAVTTRGGFRAWRSEIADLSAYLEGVTPPYVVVGDFNASRFRPEFARLLRRAVLVDAHSAVGQGLTRSLKLAARGALAQVPAFTRVDHALLSPGVYAIEIENLPTAGSDHHPFVVTLAVAEPAVRTPSA
jgi:endonuclease/exonuclease/phosphatase (EEP) superfamily protein YafD